MVATGLQKHICSLNLHRITKKQLNLLFERADLLQIGDVSEVRNMQASCASVGVLGVLSSYN